MIFESWINLHPWMTFILGIISLSVVNSMFISLGGGYKKPPSILSNPSKTDSISHTSSNKDVNEDN